MFKDMTITSLETITAFGITAGEYLWTLDELQNCSIAQSQEKTDITGKQGRKLSSLKKNKAVTISGTNGLVSGGLFELQTGGTFEKNKVTRVRWTDYITVGDTTTKTTWVAYGTAGDEILGMYIKNPDNSVGEEYTQVASNPGEKEFTYDPSTKVLTFNSAVTAGTEFVAYYDRKIAADVLTNKSDEYSKKCRLYVDAIGEDKCGNVYRVQFYIPKADFNGEFTFEMGDNQSVHNFEAEALSGGCGASTTFFTYTIFGENTPDSDSPQG